MNRANITDGADMMDRADVTDEGGGGGMARERKPREAAVRILMGSQGIHKYSDGFRRVQCIPRDSDEF